MQRCHSAVYIEAMQSAIPSNLGIPHESWDEVVCTVGALIAVLPQQPPYFFA